MIDEMAISEGLNIDLSTNFIVSSPTLPSSTGYFAEFATHALVFMLGGLNTRWKQAIGYHFTGPSICSKSFKDVVLKIVEECEKIGLTINAVVSDMGPQNQALWKECGVYAKRNKIKKKDEESGQIENIFEFNYKNYCLHSSDPDRKLYFFADPPHVFKNIRNLFLSGENISLPETVVVEENFPTPNVSIEHVKSVI